MKSFFNDNSQKLYKIKNYENDIHFSVNATI